MRVLLWLCVALALPGAAFPRDQGRSLAYYPDAAAYHTVDAFNRFVRCLAQSCR